MNDQLTAKLKYLQLDGLLAHWDDYLKLAADQHWSDTRLLTHVIEEEYRIKRGRRRQRRLQNALLPEPWAIESYPFQRQPCGALSCSVEPETRRCGNNSGRRFRVDGNILS